MSNYLNQILIEGSSDRALNQLPSSTFSSMLFVSFSLRVQYAINLAMLIEFSELTLYLDANTTGVGAPCGSKIFLGKCVIITGEETTFSDITEKVQSCVSVNIGS